jgi:hypothetical protein
MSMYLPNDDVGPTGAEGAEFIDVPVPAPDEDADDAETTSPDNTSPEEDEAFGTQAEEPGMETDAGD